MRRSAHADQPMSWSLDAAALRMTNAATRNQIAWDQGYPARPGWNAVFVSADVTPSMNPQPKIDATNQNRSSSLPIRLSIEVRDVGEFRETRTARSQ